MPGQKLDHAEFSNAQACSSSKFHFRACLSLLDARIFHTRCNTSILHQIQHILAKYAHLPKHKFFAFVRRLEKAPSGFISLQQWNFWLLLPLHICGFPNRVFTVRCNFHINILFEAALLLTTVKAKKNMENWWVPPRSIERFARVQYPLKYRDDPESTPAWLNFSKSNNTLCQQKEGASFFPFSESLL